MACLDHLCTHSAGHRMRQTKCHHRRAGRSVSYSAKSVSGWCALPIERIYSIVKAHQPLPLYPLIAQEPSYEKNMVPTCKQAFVSPRTSPCTSMSLPSMICQNKPSNVLSQNNRYRYCCQLRQTERHLMTGHPVLRGFTK